MYSFRATHLFLLFDQIYAAQQKPRTFLRKTSYDADAIQAIADHYDADAIQAIADQLPPGVTKDLFQSFSICGTCSTFKRFGEEHDGGYLHCMDSLQPSTLRAAYSMGVEQHDQWSLDVFKAFNIPIFQYDCTVSHPAQTCEKCQFFPACLSSKGLNNFPGKTSWTLKEAIEQSKMLDAPDRSLLMKMDIEGGEWSTLTDSDMATLKKFRQLVIEFHSVEKEENHKTYLQAMQALRHAGFRVAHVHGNNIGPVYVKEEFLLPYVVEVTLDASLALLPKCHDPNYEELDRPNAAASPEIRDIHTEPTEHE
eukprot:s76_g5.t1